MSQQEKDIEFKVVLGTDETQSLISPVESDIIKIDTEAGKFAEQVVGILRLVKETDPILRQPCVPFDFENPQMLPNMLALQLFETMHQLKGIGLSAVQVGLPWRVFVAGTKEHKQIFFNPEIIGISKDMILEKEGCLSFPLLYLKVNRPSWVKVRSQVNKTEFREDTFTGLTARIILHEMDHMDGRLYLQGVPKLTLQIAMDKRRKALKKLFRSAKKQIKKEESPSWTKPTELKRYIKTSKKAESDILTLDF